MSTTQISLRRIVPILDFRTRPPVWYAYFRSVRSSRNERVRPARSCKVLGAIMAPLPLTAVGFRYKPAGIVDENAIQTVNQRLLQYMQESQEAYPTATMREGMYALRGCILHPRTSEDNMRRFLAVLQAALAHCSAASVSTQR